MGFVHAARMVWVRCNIKAQDQRRDFPPVGALGRGVQQPEIGLDVTAIIVGYVVCTWWSVGKLAVSSSHGPHQIRFGAVKYRKAESAANDVPMEPSGYRVL